MSEKEKEIIPEGKTKSIGRDVTPARPSEGGDCAFAFTPSTQGATGLTAGIVGIKQGARSKTVIARKRIDKDVEYTSPSRLTKIGPYVITFEKGTGSVPDEGTYGTLVFTDYNEGKAYTYANSYVSEIGEINYEVGTGSTGTVTFQITEAPTVATATEL